MHAAVCQQQYAKGNLALRRQRYISREAVLVAGGSNGDNSHLHVSSIHYISILAALSLSVDKRAPTISSEGLQSQICNYGCLTRRGNSQQVEVQ
jgi:hypothetical protein